MIITKTPFRMSFFGGGTDMEEYFKEKQGAVISTTFDKYNYVIVRHLPNFFEYTNEIVYSKIERVSDDLDEIVHPAVREAMKMLDMKEIRLSYEADLPAKTGLGTSSSFAVGMLLAFHTLKGQYVDKEQLAKEAIYLERVLCDEKGGWQDQIAAAYGGFNRIELKMIITKTPFRMSFFGGGTDMEEYFKEKQGAVISTTFDKYNYVIVRHLPNFFEYTNEIVYSKIERVSDDLDEIVHPAVREAMKMLDMKEIRLSYEADLPAKTGLGTSSSFAVGMLLAFHTLKGQYVDKEQLAKEAIYLERVLCDEKGGWQDQIAAAYGGFNRIDFKDDKFTVKPMIIPVERKKELNSNLFMVFTGFTRFSSDIQKANQKTSKSDRTAVLDKMYSLVDEAEIILTDKEKDLDDFGRLLDVTWKLKTKTGKAVSTDSINYIYKQGIESGALGGKLLGAGGGGFMLFYVPSENHEKFLSGMKDYMLVPFEFENDGAQVIHFRHESWKNHD